jgi:hypothetical protein
MPPAPILCVGGASLFRLLQRVALSGILVVRKQSEMRMKPAADTLASMGTVQLLLAIVFLASYALALGKIAVARGRLVAGGMALITAIGFVASGSSWEASLFLLACVPVGLGLFAASAWALWILVTWRTGRAVVPVEPARSTPPEPRSAAGTTLISRLRARLHVA